jgi:hypothetical protein
LGWREWISLPDLDIAILKAKIDTGARTSSLHAGSITEFRRGKILWLAFEVYPDPEMPTKRTVTEAPLIEYRNVRSSTGHATRRPVIRTRMQWGPNRWPIELTLCNREGMGYCMLLGREAIEGRFLVDAAQSFVGNLKSGVG